jgi:hypothetical protein
VHTTTGSAIAKEALERIATLFKIEAEINGHDPGQRHAARQECALPQLAELKDFLDAARGRISRKSGLAAAIRYSLSRWSALCRFAEDGRLEMTNNAAERAIRPLATTRSFCPPCSSIWNHWKLVLLLGATRTALGRARGGDPCCPQIGSLDLIGSTGHDLLGGEDLVLDQATDDMAGDAQDLGGLTHREPRAVLLRRAVGVDAVGFAQRADTARIPGPVLTGAHPHSVQRCGDVVIVPAPGHAPDHRQRLV